MALISLSEFRIYKTKRRRPREVVVVEERYEGPGRAGRREDRPRI